MSYTEAWLSSNSAIRSIFCEVTVKFCAAGNGSVYTNQTLYFSNVGYSTLDGAVGFLPFITGDVVHSESINADNRVSISIGEVQLSNKNGELDAYIDQNTYVWSGATFVMYYGDSSWSSSSIADFRTKFLKIFEGVVFDIIPKTRDNLAILFKDKLEELNSSITDNTIGTYGVWEGGQQNANALKPLIFGEVFNISPVLINPATLEYMVHDGAIERIIEVRDNGVPVSFTPNLSAGTFTLTSNPSGTITASVQGTTTDINLGTGVTTVGYNNNVANLVLNILTRYGKAATRLTIPEVNLPNFSAFATGNQAQVGIYITERTNILTVVEELLSTFGSCLVLGRSGIANIVKFGVPRTDVAQADITEAQIILGSLSVTNMIPPVAAYKLGYCKNWTVQTEIAQGIPAAHRKLFETEYLEVNFVNSTVASLRNIDATAELTPTLFITQAGAQAEANRLGAYYATARRIVTFTGTTQLINLTLGQGVRLFHYRYNLNNGGNGTIGQVISLQPNWTKGTVQVGVIV